jgi:hypothetical protein
MATSFSSSATYLKVVVSLKKKMPADIIDMPSSSGEEGTEEEHTA